MNQSSLSWRIQCSIIAIILLLHSTILIVFFIAQMQEEKQYQNAIVMIDNDEFTPATSTTELDWVAMQNTAAPSPIKEAPTPELPPLPALTLDALPNLAAQGATKDPLIDEQIAQALAIAQQVLEEEEQPQQSAFAQPEQSKEEPAVQADDVISKEPIPGVSIATIQEKKTLEKPSVKKQESPSSPQQLAEFNHQPSSSIGKKSLSLAQLTQGFVGHLEQAAMAVKSNRTGAATAEQLKQLHFCQKIIGCVVNSYKIQRYNAPHNREMTAARIQLVVNENGSIHSLQMHKSSGNPAIDKFLLDIFKDASSSFPPIPTSFKQKTYTLPVFNIDRLEAFQSAQGWYIDNKIS